MSSPEQWSTAMKSEASTAIRPREMPNARPGVVVTVWVMSFVGPLEPEAQPGSSRIFRYPSPEKGEASITVLIWPSSPVSLPAPSGPGRRGARASLAALPGALASIAALIFGVVVACL